MLRVAITLAQITMSSRGETRDTLDIRWGSILSELNFCALPLMPSAIASSKCLYEMNIDAIILSGGGDVTDSSPRAKLEQDLLTFSKIQNIPVLGICRGMQMINYHQGGKTVKTTRHVGNRHKVLYNRKGQLMEHHVNSYHNYCITPESLGNDLEAVAYAEDNTIESLKHNSLRWLGVMWHPERETPVNKFDLALINEHFGG
jgi:gamma-glutamyl-gamma-aminobutyrate hydrolase PuuD